VNGISGVASGTREHDAAAGRYRRKRAIIALKSAEIVFRKPKTGAEKADAPAGETA
jgi:hypothetical protein